MSAMVDPKAEARQRAMTAADGRMAEAKRKFSAASLACIRGAIDAPAQVQRALQEIDAARAALREASDA